MRKGQKIAAHKICTICDREKPHYLFSTNKKLVDVCRTCAGNYNFIYTDIKLPETPTAPIIQLRIPQARWNGIGFVFDSKPVTGAVLFSMGIQPCVCGKLNALESKNCVSCNEELLLVLTNEAREYRDNIEELKVAV